MEKFTDRQIEIMEAATARIDKYGIQNLTIKTLAEDISLSEPALYRHFKSKNEIYEKITEYIFVEIDEVLKEVKVKRNKRKYLSEKMVALSAVDNQKVVTSVVNIVSFVTVVNTCVSLYAYF